MVNCSQDYTAERKWPTMTKLKWQQDKWWIRNNETNHWWEFPGSNYTEAIWHESFHHLSCVMSSHASPIIFLLPNLSASGWTRRPPTACPTLIIEVENSVTQAEEHTKSHSVTIDSPERARESKIPREREKVWGMKLWRYIQNGDLKQKFKFN